MAFTHTFPVAFLTIFSALLFARLTSILSQILSSTHCPPHTAWTWQSPEPGWRQPPWGRELLLSIFSDYFRTMHLLHCHNTRRHSDLFVERSNSSLAYRCSVYKCS